MNSLPRINPEPETLAQADAVLHRYFSAEVPTHWPPPPAVKPVPRRRFALRRNHLALAASFLVAVGCWWLCGLGSGGVPDNQQTIRGEGGSGGKAEHKKPTGPKPRSHSSEAPASGSHDPHR